MVFSSFMDRSLLLMLLKAFERQIVESDINFTCLTVQVWDFDHSAVSVMFFVDYLNVNSFVMQAGILSGVFLLWCNLPKFGLRSLLPIQSIKQWSCCNNRQYLCSDWPCHLLLNMASVLFYWTSFSSLFTLDSRPSEQFFSKPSKM